MKVKEGFGNQINLCRDRGLNPGRQHRSPNTLPLDRQDDQERDVDIAHLVLGRQSLVEQASEGRRGELVHVVHFVQVPDSKEQLTAALRQRPVHVTFLSQLRLESGGLRQRAVDGSTA
uniref:Uncharacterized protein n=1 Tax=Timema shepardi TaxID=629360 RepID=A0A7R9G5L0_TIMSH|nr:unnamed protein product [Timema shepardi]